MFIFSRLFPNSRQLLLYYVPQYFQVQDCMYCLVFPNITPFGTVCTVLCSPIFPSMYCLVFPNITPFWTVCTVYCSPAFHISGLYA